MAEHWCQQTSYNYDENLGLILGVYQYMTILSDGTLGLLWEREMQGLYFTRIPLEWIEAAKQ